MNICIVAGARPNFVKVAPIVRAVEKAQQQGRDISYTLVYAGVANDPTLEASLFDDLQMAPPSVYLGVDCPSLNELTGRVMGEFEKYLEQHDTDVVIVVDDLASTMAAAIVTKKQGKRLAHLVAGTRSFDIKMPKEINRLVIDGLSDFLFTAGEGANNIVSREGVSLSQTYMVGNILMDSLRFNRNRLQRPEVADRLQLADGGYIVFTLNRKALVADTANLRQMLKAIVNTTQGCPVVAPLRGLARSTVEQLLTTLNADTEHFHLIEPLSYLQFGYRHLQRGALHHAQQLHRTHRDRAPRHQRARGRGRRTAARHPGRHGGWTMEKALAARAMGRTVGRAHRTDSHRRGRKGITECFGKHFPSWE